MSHQFDKDCNPVFFVGGTDGYSVWSFSEETLEVSQLLVCFYASKYKDSQNRNLKMSLFPNLANATVLDISSSSLSCYLFKLLVQVDGGYYLVTFNNNTVRNCFIYTLENLGEYF